MTQNLHGTTNIQKTHFLVLLLLTALSLIGFTAATLTITDADGNVPLESRMVFAGLSAVYVLFFNFCKDMNDPFDVSCDASFHICAFSYEHRYIRTNFTNRKHTKNRAFTKSNDQVQRATFFRSSGSLQINRLEQTSNLIHGV